MRANEYMHNSSSLSTYVWTHKENAVLKCYAHNEIYSMNVCIKLAAVYITDGSHS